MVAAINEPVPLLGEALEGVQQLVPALSVQGEDGLQDLPSGGAGEGVPVLAGPLRLARSHQQLLHHVLSSKGDAIVHHHQGAGQGQEAFQGSEIEADDLIHRSLAGPFVEKEGLPGRGGEVRRPVADADVPGPVAQEVAPQGGRRLDIFVVAAGLPGLYQRAHILEKVVGQATFLEGEDPVDSDNASSWEKLRIVLAQHQVATGSSRAQQVWGHLPGVVVPPDHRLCRCHLSLSGSHHARKGGPGGCRQIVQPLSDGRQAGRHGFHLGLDVL